MYIIKRKLFLYFCTPLLVSLPCLIHHTCLVFVKLTLNTATQPEQSTVRNAVLSLRYEGRSRFQNAFQHRSYSTL